MKLFFILYRLHQDWAARKHPRCDREFFAGWFFISAPGGANVHNRFTILFLHSNSPDALDLNPPICHLHFEQQLQFQSSSHWHSSKALRHCSSVRCAAQILREREVSVGISEDFQLWHMCLGNKMSSHSQTVLRLQQVKHHRSWGIAEKLSARRCRWHSRGGMQMAEMFPSEANLHTNPTNDPQTSLRIPKL